MKIIMRRDSMIFFLENHRIDNAVRRCLSDETKWFYQILVLKEIQAWLGHSTIGTTANIYTHLDENNKLSSANAILSILPEK